MFFSFFVFVLFTRRFGRSILRPSSGVIFSSNGEKRQTNFPYYPCLFKKLFSAEIFLLADIFPYEISDPIFSLETYFFRKKGSLHSLLKHVTDLFRYRLELKAVFAVS